MTVNTTNPRDAASDRGEDRSQSDAEDGDPTRMSGKHRASERFGALASSLDLVPVEMLRDLSLNPEDDPEDTPSVITLRGEDDGAEDLATIADLERDVEVVSRWIADEEAEAEERRRRLEAIRNDTESEARRGSGTYRGDGTRDTARLGDGEANEDAKNAETRKETGAPRAREMALAKLRRRKLLAELEAARAREALKIAALEFSHDSMSVQSARRTREVQLEVERLQLYIGVCEASRRVGGLAGDPDRRLFFYADCHVGGLGKWYAWCLSERPNWHPYPAATWFLNPKDATPLFCPVGKVLVDFTDQPAFSLAVGGCPGSDWLEDKSRLARLLAAADLSHLHIPTWFVRDREWVPANEGPTEADARAIAASNDFWHDVWFVKEAKTNFGVGVRVAPSPERCLAVAEPGKTYVVQPSVASPRVDARGHKLGWRVYIACVSAPNARALRWYMFCGGYLVAADGPLARGVLDPLGHVTKDRVCAFDDWPEGPAYEPIMREKITAMLRAAQPKMKPPVAKACFELFGVDLIVRETEARVVHREGDEGGVFSPDPDAVRIVEVNRSPRVKIDDKPMLHALLNIAVPKYGIPQHDAVWDLLDVDPEMCDTWHPDARDEREERDVWGGARWDGGGRDGQNPMPSAFGGDQHWGARAEKE
jgi:hypothetical protein